MDTLRNIVRWLHAAEGWLLVVILGFMTCLAFAQIVLRNFTGGGFAWADVLNRHLVLWIGFLGAAIATKEGRHINIDIVSKLLPKKANHAVEILIDVASAVICFFLGHAAHRFVEGEREFSGDLFEIGDFGVPAWWVQIIIPLGFYLISARFTIRAGLRVAEFVTGTDYLAHVGPEGAVGMASLDDDVGPSNEHKDEDDDDEADDGKGGAA